ncbi:hypothetical protein IAE37_001772 [Pseudomonas sp. S31]|uniref:hypothetical protein n=1 Tax=Pseudomonas sp. S31 TaxID=1564473 RepID=UPI001912CBC5|nr:hypothetical protein [Pseudomonas sp. S31]MBK4999496.1 hypothetical protein [Pseudomonas sp. S31]
MSQAKERPILFSAPMVRAILEGRKTVTRRAAKVQPRSKGDIGSYGLGQPFIRHPESTKRNPECPYGRPGDRLWVRETHKIATGKVGDIQASVRYEADGDYQAKVMPQPEAIGARTFERTRPSIHMPRWASRILLEITDVRVERLQDGEGETDFESRYVAEGIHRIHHGDGEHYYHPFKSEPGPGNWADPFDAWRELWVSINGADSWNANPWVWVVEFKQVAA